MSRFSLHRERSRASKIALLIAGILLLALLVGVGVIRHKYHEGLKPVSASQRSQLVTVELGSSVNEIANELKKSGLIKETWAFEWYVRNNSLRDKLQAGSYYLRPSQSVPEISNVLTQGEVATDLVTILPGQRIDQIRQSLIRSGFDGADVDAALQPDVYKDHPALVDKPPEANLEGYLYPESFQKDVDTELTTIIRSSLDEMQKRLTPEVRAGFVQQGLTVHQGVILSSIVEQEVNNKADKPKVAQVFLTRLKMNMQLGSDVTAFYGALKDGKKASVLYDSPYNTRIYAGYQPGPISNVTDASLLSVARPATTDFVYFVAGDDGVTYFSKTLQEHEALTAQHCKKLCSE